MKISDIDKNFEIKTNLNIPDIKWIDATEDCFRLHGIIPPDADCEWYHRIPNEIAEKTSKNVAWLNKNTAGGRIRFCTDSDFVAIHIKLIPASMAHMPLTGTSAFDLYSAPIGQEVRFIGNYIPTPDNSTVCESVFNLPNGMKQIMIHFPLYCNVQDVKIGLSGSAIAKPTFDYAVRLPFVTYGSSITQGGCASHPGNSYQAILSRRLDCDHLNLGFSGSACGELCMAQYISKLPMSAFIMDYDHNAPTVEHLQKTHQVFFETVRKANPVLPIILLNRPMYLPDEEVIARKNIVEETYQKAIDAGDKNVRFIDCNHVFDRYVKECWSVDQCHPTDAGFVAMAEALEPVLREFL